MNDADLQLLKNSVGQRVILRCADGEVILAEIHSVSEEDADVIYDVVSSNRPDNSGKAANRPAYLLSFGELDSVELPVQGGCE